MGRPRNCCRGWSTGWPASTAAEPRARRIPSGGRRCTKATCDLWSPREPRQMVAMKTVAEILKSKGSSSIYALGPNATVYEAVALMAEKNVGALLVMEGDKVVGII